jgi:hypothetical protein
MRRDEKRRRETMARKEIEQREVWFTDTNIRCANELDALVSDVVNAFETRDAERMKRYADALHEYAHRDTQKDQPARPTLDEISKLRKGDEVMVSGAWFLIEESVDITIGNAYVDFEDPGNYTVFSIKELAAICQGIRRHGQ